jgi:hypothetical protein
MPFTTPDYKLAAGNDNAGGLVLVTSITDANGVNYVMPQGLPYRFRGVRAIALNGVMNFIGFNSAEWLFSVMTLAQYAKMLSTYEGLVTIRHGQTSASFANYNAVLTMPDERDMDYAVLNGSVYDAGFVGPGYRNVVASLRKLEAL